MPRLQDRLILQNFLLSLLGVDSFKSLKAKLSGQLEGWADDGHSYFFRVLEGIDGLRIPPDRLAEYDLQINAYTQRLNRVRPQPIQLKYFQYVAVLFSEIFLDRLFNRRTQLLKSFNDLVTHENGKLSPADRRYPKFSGSDLAKLAFWMATGSGKTLVMHINLWQYLHYSQGKTAHDNVLLVTPNEGLSRQHIEEMRKSGIAARHYGERYRQ